MRHPQFDRSLSLAIDKHIKLMEASRPTAQKPLRMIKRALEAGIPAGQVRR